MSKRRRRISKRTAYLKSYNIRSARTYNGKLFNHIGDLGVSQHLYEKYKQRCERDGLQPEHFDSFFGTAFKGEFPRDEVLKRAEELRNHIEPDRFVRVSKQGTWPEVRMYIAQSYVFFLRKPNERSLLIFKSIQYGHKDRALIAYKQNKITWVEARDIPAESPLNTWT